MPKKQQESRGPQGGRPSVYDAEGYTPRQKLDLVHAQRALLELNILKGKYISVADVEERENKACLMFKESCLGLPSNISGECVGKSAVEISEIIKKKVHEMLMNLERALREHK